MEGMPQSGGWPEHQTAARLELSMMGGPCVEQVCQRVKVIDGDRGAAGGTAGPIDEVFERPSSPLHNGRWEIFNAPLGAVWRSR